MEATLVYPHQLYKHTQHLHGLIILVEDELFFRQYNFHKQKLLLHRASMKCYEEFLKARGHSVKYIDAYDPASSTEALFAWLSIKEINTVHYIDPTDYLLERRIKRFAAQYNISLQQYASPNFICTLDDIDNYFKNGKKYFLASFYASLRKRLQLLMDGTQPTGGRWSFDHENRKKLPKTFQAFPEIPLFDHPHIDAAKKYVAEYFPGNFGSVEKFYFPINHQQADKALEIFFKDRFALFGPYQDAIVSKEYFLFHSVLSSSLNTGLFSPGEVINKAIAYAAQNAVPINSLEGFIRQILGWREYIRAVYVREGVKQRTTNFFGFTRGIPDSFYSGKTNISPVDTVIGKLQQSSYAHHIERLMVMGNFMLLCEFQPDEVYKWFMELFIDAYDWVMVPNVYGMSQFADGGLMSTKPYISSSNYLLKMSNFRKGQWTDIWDALFWRFMHVHRSTFAGNQRLSILLNTFDKMTADRRQHIMKMANFYLYSLENIPSSNQGMLDFE